MFSISLTILYASILGRDFKVFNWQVYIIDYDKLNVLYNNLAGRYSKELISKIHVCLFEDEKLRPGLGEMFIFLKRKAKDILKIDIPQIKNM